MKKKTDFPVLIYQNKRKSTLNFVSMICLGLSFFVFYMIFHDLEGFFMEYSDIVYGYLALSFFLIAGNIMLLTMVWLSGRYVLMIKQINHNELLISTWSIIGFHKSFVQDVQLLKDVAFISGDAHFSGVPKVNAPWIKLITSKNKTLVVDIQGDFANWRFK